MTASYKGTFHRLDFNRRLKFAIAGIAAAVFLILAIARFVEFSARRNRLLDYSERRTSNLARILAEHLHQVFAVTDLPGLDRCRSRMPLV
jgi:hypothetical protein